MGAGGEVAGEVIGVGSAEAVGLAHQRAIDPEGSSPHAALERERHLLALPAGGHLYLAGIPCRTYMHSLACQLPGLGPTYIKWCAGNVFLAHARLIGRAGQGDGVAVLGRVGGELPRAGKADAIALSQAGRRGRQGHEQAEQQCLGLYHEFLCYLMTLRPLTMYTPWGRPSSEVVP